MTTRIYNYTFDKVDTRDHLFHLKYTVPSTIPLPVTIDLRMTGCVPPVLNQLALGSCTANATSSALGFSLNKKKKPFWTPSRLFIYYYTRLLQDINSINEDTGASLRNTLKSVATYGVCSENNWSYENPDVRFTLRPPKNTILAAKTHIANFNYLAVSQTLDGIKTALYLGNPIVFGILLYESFEKVNTNGKVPLPNVSREKLLGGHAMLIVGVNATDFIVKNSYGTSFGDRGFCYIPHSYVLNKKLAQDFWVVKNFE